MTPYVAVAGTEGLARQGAERWWVSTSPLACFLRGHGLEHLKPTDPFIWSTDLDGVGVIRKFVARMFFGGTFDDKRDWEACGAALRYYCEPQSVNIASHSHGMQGVLFACADERHPLRIDNLITFGGPVREDMKDVAEKARPNIRRWLHVSSPGTDKIELLGELGGSLRLRYTEPLADYNDEVPGIDHSRVLMDVSAFHYWTDLSWIDFLAGRPFREAKAA